MFALDAAADVFAQRAAWAFLHFLWQGSLVAMLLAVALRLLWRHPANVRYAACVIALGAMVACPPITWLAIAAQTEPVTERTVGQPPTPVSATDIVSALPATPLDLSDTSRTAIAAQDTVSVANCSTAVALRWVWMGWLVGAALMSVRLAVGSVGTVGLRLGARSAPAAWNELAATLSARLGLRAGPRLRIGKSNGDAIVVGLLRPTILLPAAWLLEVTPEILEATLAHELAHLHRHDLWVIHMQRLAETLLFYHPAVWWISSRLHAERELCCDELAVTATGDRVAYARALETLAGRRMDLAQPAAALAFAHGGGKMMLLNRVRRVLGISPLRPKFLGRAAGLSAVAVPLALGMVLAVAAPPEAGLPSRRDAGAAPSVATKPVPATVKPFSASAKYNPPKYNPPADATEKYFVINTKFLCDDGSTLMAPRVTVREGEIAFVKNGSESPFVTRLTSVTGGVKQPNIEILHEGVCIELKAVGDTDGLINVDATVEVSDIASVGTKTVAKTTRQSPRRKSQTVRAIESVAIGEKLVIPLENPRPKQPPVTTLQALSNVVLGKRPPETPPRTTGLEITVREVKTVPHDGVDGPQVHPPVAATRDPERTAAVPDHRRPAAGRSNRASAAVQDLRRSPAPSNGP